MNRQSAQRTRCAFVGDQSLLVRCVAIARDAGLDVALVASHNSDLLQAASGPDTELIELTSPGDLAPALAGRHFDALFSVAYLHIVPESVLELADIAINFHDGPLPEYGGLNVTSWAIANGETRHGITWHHMTADLDSGDGVVESRFDIAPVDTAFSLNARCFEAGVQAFVELAENLANDDLPRSQSAGRPDRMYRRRQRPTLVVDPQVPAAQIARSIRALEVGNRLVNTVGSPHLVVDELSYVVSEAHDAPGTNRPTGAVDVGADGEIRIATADGDLVIGALHHADGRVAHIEAGQVASATGLADVLAEADPLLSDNENWWRDELAVAVAATSLDELDLSKPFVSTSLALDAAPAEVAAALTLILASRSETDTVSLAVTDSATGDQMSRLAPLLSPPQLHVTVDVAAAVDSHRLLVERSMADALDHGPFLTDIIERDPALRAQTLPPAAHLRIGSAATPTADSAELVLSLEDRELTLHARGEQAALDSIAEQLTHVVAMMQASPDAPLGSVGLTTATDHETLAVLNDTVITSAATTIDDQFRMCASELGDRPAISCAGVTLSYDELSARVDAIAKRLIHAGVRTGDIVGIALERDLDLVPSVLAVLSAGATYLPLDLDYPTDRLQFMLDDSGTTVVIGRSGVNERFNGSLTILDPADRHESADALADGQHTVEDLAYVIYTSGSTGTPKGVQLEHRQVDNFFTGMDAVIDGDVPGVWLAVTSLSFDISVLELLWTVTRGFHVVIKQSNGFRPAPSFDADAPSMSLFHFAASDAQARDGYRLLLESSKWADKRGFEAVWTPERHFHDFGAPYPNPSVVAAAVAAVTEQIHVRAGSVVLPLHSPVRVAEEWSVVDNLSNGRVGISFAAGWQQDDFVLNPTGFANAREELPEQIDTVRKLWRGETVDLPGPEGETVAVRTLPRPVQEELPVWLTSAGSPSSFERAGTLGVNLLTHLLGQTLEQLTENVALYRSARRAAGHEGDGRVTLMLHTFLNPDGEAARETARQPLIDYLGTAVGLIKSKASMFPTFSGASKADDDAFSSLDDDDVDQLLELAAERYLSTSGLFGTVDDALDMIASARTAGIDEIACLVDFGIDPDVVLQSLDLLGQVEDLVRNGTPETVGSLVEQYNVTHMQCTPSLASMIVTDPDGRQALSTLDHMMVGGEALSTELAADLAGLVPGRLTNMYGPTETTIWSLTHEVPASSSGAIPIGTPIANTSVHILDRHHRVLPTGVFGELYLGGDGVARGYLERPELNAERFIELPGLGRVYATGDIARVRHDGVVEFAGRRDGQVKVRGHRIEVGEIEAALDRMDSVSRSVVVATGEQEPTLRAFILPSGEAPDGAQLAKQLGETLPAQMIPASIEVIDRFPHTPNGKIDRKNLSERPRQTAMAQSDAVITSDTESIVAAAWRDQLGGHVGRTDNFFDIGGHSLIAVNVFRALSATTGAPISLTDVFRYPTVEQFSAHLDRLLGGAQAEAPTPDPTSGSARGSRRRQALAGRRKDGEGK